MLAGGIYLLVAERSHTVACSASTNLVAGATSACQSAGWVYFLGVALLALGLVMLVFATLVRRHESRYRRPNPLPSDYTLQLRQASSQWRNPPEHP